MSAAEPADVASDLADLDAVPLGELPVDDAEETLRRVAPRDGARLLVAASFNSAI